MPKRKKGETIQRGEYRIVENFSIYALTDPRKENKVFYVGKGKNPEGRLYKHINQTINGCNNHKCNTIRAIWEQGLEVGLEILCPAEDENKAFELEKKWIDFYGLENLTNQTNGGEGTSGLEPSKKTRQKISESLKDVVPWNKGKKGCYSEETLKKLSEALKGSPGRRLGRKASEETRKKISIGQKGEKSYWFGKSFSEETRKKMSIAKQNMTEETKRKISEATKGEKNPFYGKKHSKEARIKMSEAQRGEENASKN